VLYTGKGGVGKTTTAAATALCAAERGVRTLVVSSDVAHSLGDVLDCELAAIPAALAPKPDAMEIDARAEMSRHYGSIRDYLVELFLYQGIDEVVAEELALLPGAEEITALLAVEEIARSGLYDFIVVDCAPTGSTLRMLTLPDMLTGALRALPSVMRVLSSVVSPIAQSVLSAPVPPPRVFRDLERLVDERARQLRRRLSARDTSVRIVVTPERLVIDGARRAYMELSLFDLGCDAVVMNRLLPPEASDEDFFRDWLEVQHTRRKEVEDFFSPLEILDAPLQRDEVIGIDALAAHGRQPFAEREPHAVISRAPRIRFTRHRAPRRKRGVDAGADEHRVHVPLPGASYQDLDVAVVEADLIVRAGGRRRAIPLPPRIARLTLRDARLEEGVLIVAFSAAESAAKPASGEAS